MKWDPLEEARARLVSLSLSELVDLKRSLEAELSVRVRDQRLGGLTWAQIASTLGCSTSEAHRRYAAFVAAHTASAPTIPVLPGQTRAL